MKRSALPLATLVLFALTLSACPKGGDRVVNMKDFRGGNIGEYKPTACADDAREEDDEAAYVLAKTSKDGEKFEAVSCPADDDFIHLFAKGRTGAAITWNPAHGDLSVELLDESGGPAPLDGPTDASEQSNGRVVEKRMNVRGDFFLRVRNASGTRLEYRVEIGATAGDAPPTLTR